MKLQIRQRDRRSLIVLVLALVIYGLAQVVILPAYDRISAAREDAADKENQLRRYRRAELRKGQYADLLKTAATQVTQNESVVIPATSASLASSELQSLVEGAGNTVGLTVGQRTLGTPRRLNAFYAELPMTVNFESTPGQLVSFLDQLHRLPRFLNIRSLQVSPVESATQAPVGVDVTKTVRVAMTISGLFSATAMKPESVTR